MVSESVKLLLPCRSSATFELNIFMLFLFFFAEFGLDDDNLSKEEMSDLLKALQNSKSTAKEDELLRQKVSIEIQVR